MTMTDSQYLDVALDFIVAKEKDTNFICKTFADWDVVDIIDGKYKYLCQEDCQGLNRICVLRFLKELWQRKNNKNTSTI